MLATEDSFALRPSATQAGVEGRPLHAVQVEPVLEDVGRPVDFDVPAVAAVPVLRDAQGPDAVRGAVPEVVVQAFDGVPVGRSRPHVLDEILVPFPSVAVRDASASVVPPRGVVGVRAPGLHAGPHAVLGMAFAGAVAADVHAVGDGFRPHSFEVQAPATSSEALREAVSLNLSRFSAVAGAEPPRSAAPWRKPLGGCEAAEFVAGFDGTCAPAVRGDACSEARSQYFAFEAADTSAVPGRPPPSTRSRGEHRPVAEGFVGEIEGFGHRSTLHEKGAAWQRKA